VSPERRRALGELGAMMATCALFLVFENVLHLKLQFLIPCAALWIAPLYGVAMFAVFTGGAFAARRSPGALDDGAACAVLVRLAERLVATPLQRTAVEIVLFSGEEIGVEGSWQYVRERFRLPPGQPTSAVNLEVIGAASTLALVRNEAFVLRRYAPDPDLVAALEAVHARLRGRPLARTPLGGATDARSFLARGVSAATLVSHRPGQLFFRGLHSARDDRARLDERALDDTLDYLFQVARALDDLAPNRVRQTPERLS